MKQYTLTEAEIPPVNSMSLYDSIVKNFVEAAYNSARVDMSLEEKPEKPYSLYIGLRRSIVKAGLTGKIRARKVGRNVYLEKEEATI